MFHLHIRKTPHSKYSLCAAVQRNFNKYTNLDSHGTAYDYDSMMHYGGTAFGSGKITIETKDPKYQKVIGQRAKMSEIDKKQINAMYGCGGGGGGSEYFYRV